MKTHSPAAITTYLATTTKHAGTAPSPLFHYLLRV